MTDKHHHPDYAEIARLEREVFGDDPPPEPPPPSPVQPGWRYPVHRPAPPLKEAPQHARCSHCGAHVPFGSSWCPQCQGIDYWIDNDG